MIEENLQPLIISGQPTIKELQNAWSNIIEEYKKNVADGEYILYLETYRELRELEFLISNIKFCVLFLRKNNTQYFINELNDCLRPFKFIADWNDQVEWKSKLDDCLTRIIGFETQLEMKQISFNSLQKKEDSEEGKADEGYYTSIMITLSDHAGYQLPDTILTLEYVKRLKRYLDFAKAHKEKYG